MQGVLNLVLTLIGLAGMFVATHLGDAFIAAATILTVGVALIVLNFFIYKD